MKRPDGSLISFFSNRVKKEGGINLAQGIPGFTPPVELMEALKRAAVDVTVQQYAPGIGNYRLLSLIRDKLSMVGPVDTDNLLVLQGATEGIHLAFFYLTTILERPFSALSFDPVYESYPILADLFKVPFHYMDVEADLTVDFSKLEAMVTAHKVGVVFIASPGNPLGKVWDMDEMAQLVGLSKKHGFYIIFDAVYKDIYFNKPPFNPLVFGYDRLFYIDSFSKTLSITGWRIGYLIAGCEHMRNIRGIHDYTGLCAPSVLQVAVAEYLADNQYGQDYIDSVKSRCRETYEYMAHGLSQLGFRVSPIDGGYFLWARLPEGWDDAFEFAMELYEKVQVAVVPGENFSNTKNQYIRVNIAAMMPVIKDALDRLKQFFHQT